MAKKKKKKSIFLMTFSDMFENKTIGRALDAAAVVYVAHKLVSWLEIKDFDKEVAEPFVMLPEDKKRWPALPDLLKTESVSVVPGGIAHYKPIKRSNPNVYVPEVRAILHDEMDEIEGIVTELGENYELEGMMEFRRQLFGEPDSGVDRPGILPSMNVDEISPPERDTDYIELSIDLGRNILPDIVASDPKMWDLMEFDFTENGVRLIRRGLNRFFSAFAFNPFGEKPSRRLHIIKASGRGGRSYFSGSERAVAIGPTMMRESVEYQLSTWHELSHALEFVNPAIGRASNAFLRYRCNNEKIRRLRDLGIKRYLGYNPREVAAPDEFFTAYIGRKYPMRKRLKLTDFPSDSGWDRGTEIFAMGAEAFAAGPVDMLDMWRRDPEHFAFTSAVFRGKFGYVLTRQ